MTLPAIRLREHCWKGARADLCHGQGITDVGVIVPPLFYRLKLRQKSDISDLLPPCVLAALAWLIQVVLAIVEQAQIEAFGAANTLVTALCRSRSDLDARRRQQNSSPPRHPNDNSMLSLKIANEFCYRSTTRGANLPPLLLLSDSQSQAHLSSHHLIETSNGKLWGRTLDAS